MVARGGSSEDAGSSLNRPHPRHRATMKVAPTVDAYWVIRRVIPRNGVPALFVCQAAHSLWNPASLIYLMVEIHRQT
jgi:hypothetical protein